LPASRRAQETKALAASVDPGDGPFALVRQFDDNAARDI
jgi:hypothetical protein